MSADEDKKFLPKVTVSYSPTLFVTKMPILLASFENLPLPVQALVDSGATNSLLHPRVAKSIGLKLDYDKVQHGTGAGGDFKYVQSKPVETGLLGQKYMIVYEVVLDENFAWPCILGHNSIFKLAKIVFKSFKQEFDVFFRADYN